MRIGSPLGKKVRDFQYPSLKLSEVNTHLHIHELHKQVREVFDELSCQLSQAQHRYDFEHPQKNWDDDDEDESESPEE